MKEEIQSEEFTIRLNNYQDTVDLADLLMKNNYIVTIKTVLKKELDPLCCSFRDDIDYFILNVKEKDSMHH